MKRSVLLLWLSVGVLGGCGRSEPYRPVRSDGGADAGADADAGCTNQAPGCSDGTREGFLDGCGYPEIAGCSGGFELAGVRGVGAHCGKSAGNDSPNPSGTGCSAEDLCASGWHLCRSAGEVQQASPDGCEAVASLPLFFVTAQSGSGCGVCATGDLTNCSSNSCQRGCFPTAEMSNDVFGCGGLGAAPDPSTCAPLNRFGNDLCVSLESPWSCGSNGVREAYLLVKSSAALGGSLCCHD